MPGAFDAGLNPMGSKLKAMFSSDIGHWDVDDIARVLEEAYELVEHGHIDLDDFRAFTFDNVVELHGSLNPGFFAGTAVEAAVEQRPGGITVPRAEALRPA